MINSAEIRDRLIKMATPLPDYAALHPGYG